MKKLNITFVGGIISPQLFGRIDLERYQTGLADCRNLCVLPHGALQKRPGMRYINVASDSSRPVRLIPFSYNADQTAVIEMGHEYARVIINGGLGLTEQTNELSLFDGGFDVEEGALFADVGQQVWLSWLVGGDRRGRVCVVTEKAGANYKLESFDGLVSGYDLVPEGATALELQAVIMLETPYDAADLFGINYVQSAEVLTLVHPDYPVQEIRRLGVDDWTISEPVFQPIVAAPEDVEMNATLTSGTPEDLVIYSYRVTALTTGGVEESVASLDALTDASELVITNIQNINVGSKMPNFFPRVTTSTNHNFRTGDMVSFVEVAGMTQLNGRTSSVSRIVSATQFDVTIRSENFDDYTGGGKVRFGDANNLSQRGAYNTINWSPVEGADRYNVYKLQNGAYGYIGQTTEITFRDSNITPDLSKTPPESVNPFDGVGNYPSAVCYFEQRRCFAATHNNPQNIWMSRPATESNFSSSLPTNDGDAISFKIASREQNRIRHLVPIDDLVAFTVGSEFRIYTNADIVAPATIAARPQSYTGASQVQPVTTNGTVLYVQAQGDRVRELGFVGDAGTRAYRSNDLCRIAHHLFDDHLIVDMTFVSGSQAVCWCVRDDGKLVALTYVPEEKVIAWHLHETDGVVESIAAVFESGLPVVYLVVRREIDGEQRRYIEQMSGWRTTTRQNAFFVDAGLTYTGTPRTTFTGLDHLEGCEVAVLADGSVMPRATVTNGSISIQHPASVVHVGLPYRAVAKTLPLALEGVEAAAQATRKTIKKVSLNVDKSSGLKAGNSEATLYEAKERTTEPFGAPPSLLSGYVDVPVSTGWTDGGQVVVAQDDPLPLSILSMVLEVSLGQ